MFFENAVEGYEYSGRGTCFLCRYRGHDFIVALKHVVNGFKPDSIRVLFHQADREFVPYNGQITIKPDVDDQSEDDDWREVMLYPLERSLYRDEQFANQRPYEILSPLHLWQPGMAGRLVMRGFTHDRSYIDYDDAVLHEQAVIVEADYTRSSPMKLCHEIRFRDLSHFTDLDGLSGAPVFWVSDAEPRVHCFAGVATRGTYSSGIGHFVHGSVVETIAQSLAGTPGGPP
jgi:hypothetical protein